MEWKWCSLSRWDTIKPWKFGIQSILESKKWKKECILSPCGGCAGKMCMVNYLGNTGRKRWYMWKNTWFSGSCSWFLSCLASRFYLLPWCVLQAPTWSRSCIRTVGRRFPRRWLTQGERSLGLTGLSSSNTLTGLRGCCPETWGIVMFQGIRCFPPLSQSFPRPCFWRRCPFSWRWLYQSRLGFLPP